MSRRNYKSRTAKCVKQPRSFDKFTTCPWCKVSQKHAAYWDRQKSQYMKICQTCLKKKRKKAARKRPNYRTYINSRAWKNKRLEYWNDPYTYKECYVCADPWIDFSGKELHHRTYDRLGHERLDDLVPVCHDCHARITSMWHREAKKPSDVRHTLWEITDIVRDQFQ